MKSQFADDHYYHIYNRGAHKSPIFFSDGDYQLCLILLRQYSEKYKVSVIAYCLMPNHYHLLLKQNEGGSISRFLQTMFNAYTQTINKQQNLHGTLFESRAQSIHVDSDSYLLKLICYIHCNPVIAGMVPSPDEWLFSDYITWAEKSTDTLRRLPGASHVTFARSLESSFRKSYFETGDEYAEFIKLYLQEKRDEKLEKYFFDET